METEVKPKTKSASISIRPFIEHSRENMGLEKYGMVLFEGAMYEEPVAYTESNGVRIYRTGLNEYAQEIENLPEEEKEAKIKEIREIVADLERKMVSNVLNVKDKDFWSKVKHIRNDNTKLWDELIIRVGNDPIFLNPAKEWKDMLIYKAIEANGFTIVAPSLEHAKKNPSKYKFYLDKYEETISHRTEEKKLRNKALAELELLFNKNTNKLFYVAKIIDSNSPQYKKSTPNDVLYDNMDKYINGELLEKNKLKTAQHFLNTAELDVETLKLRALVKDASYQEMLRTKPDGYIYHMKTGVNMGRTPSECVEFLRNPLHEDILNEVLKAIEKHWNN